MSSAKNALSIVGCPGGGTAFFGPDAALAAARRGKLTPTSVLAPCARTALLWGGTLVHAGEPVSSGRRQIFVASFTPVEKKPEQHRRPALGSGGDDDMAVALDVG